MTVFDANANLAIATVDVAPAPPGSGTSLTVDDASSFPADPFYALVWPPDVCATLANAEIVRVTAVAGNVFTIDRAEGGTTAQPIAAGWQIANTLTAEVIDEIEAAITALETDITNAVIVNPGSSVRNTITPTGDFVALPIVGAVGQTADLFNAKVGGATNPFFRITPQQAVGIGAGTFTPSSYASLLSRFVVSNSQLIDANGGPAVVPSAVQGVAVSMFDANIAPSADGAKIVRGVYMLTQYTTDKTSTNMFGVDFSGVFYGTKATGANQLTRFHGLNVAASTDATSTGDVARLRGIVASVSHNGSGYMSGSGFGIEGANFTASFNTATGRATNVFAVHADADARSGAGIIDVNVIAYYGQARVGTTGPSVPLLSGALVNMQSGGRPVGLAAGYHVSGPMGGHANVSESRGISIDTQTGASANPYAIYSAGGKSLLISGIATEIPISVRGFAAQSERLQRWEDSAAALLLGVSSAGVLEWGSGADVNLYRGGANQLKTDDDLAVGANVIVGAGGYAEMTEISVPTTPAANKLRLFARDSGAGKTQLVAVFESGNTVVIAEDF